MTIIDYFNQFWEAHGDLEFTPNEVYLYFYLLSVWNTTGRKEEFECNTSHIIQNIKITKPTLIDCRKRLQKKGLIKFREGNRKSLKPVYELIHFTNDFTNNLTNDFTTHRVYRDIEKESISKDIPKKDDLSLKQKNNKTFNLDFVSPNYLPIIESWLEYKRKKKQSYKSEASIKVCYNNLLKLSNNSPTIAQLIVEQSIANNYSGLFELKQNGGQIQNSNHAGYCSKQEANEYALNQFLRYREARDNGLLDEVEKPF